jgi:hypothetical protein
MLGQEANADAVYHNAYHLEAFRREWGMGLRVEPL